ncbi:hypothetical protein OKW46_004979 [Paraburkholderia sp. WSM4179]|nr:hypothetical protein [Paraburkholderia sp. WSM4179]
MLCSIDARTTAAVFSGRIVRFSPFNASVKLYISFSTMSVTSPIPRVNSCVCSTIGVRIFWYPYERSIDLTVVSKNSQSPASCGRMSFMPFTPDSFSSFFFCSVICVSIAGI